MLSHLKPSLESGLTALKQGDNQTAIAILKVIATKEGDRPVGLQAQIGLVVAYARSGEVTKAIFWCEALSQNDNPQIKQWADNSLEQLTKRNQDDVSNVTTGFVPFENSLITSIGQEKKAERVQEEQGKMKEIPNPTTPVSPSSTTNVGIPFNHAKAKPLTIHWRQAERAKVWQPPQKPNLILLRLLMVGTFIALLWVMRELLVFVMILTNNILVKLPFLEPIQLLSTDPTIFLLLLLLILIGLSPWLLDLLLTSLYAQQPLEKETLNRYSPEAVRVLQRYCQHKGWRLPKLSVLPMTSPMALTYGNLPRTARIMVSQGLLEQLADDEIATIYANELGHIAYWDYVIMSLVLLVTIPAYQLYQQFSKWGDRTSQKLWRLVMGIMATLAYGVWCLLTGTALWLSQLRLYYSDSFATGVTGNPNGAMRALLKIALGIATDIQTEEQTSLQLESLNLLTPVGYQQSICLGSIAPHTTFESFLMWDYLNPYRWWFVINNTHPLMGDRLQRLASIAQKWHLATELYLESQQPLRIKSQSFLLQIAPFLGIPLGLVFAALIWLGWQMAFLLKFLNLKWIYDDWSFVTGCLLICVSIGILIRMNSFFPEIKPQQVQTDDSLPDLLANPTFLPINSVKVCLVGKLIGRRGTRNYLGQDLILQSSTGLVKLHYMFSLGQKVLPQDLVGRKVIVTGWLRRGATPWIDVQTLQTQSGKTLNSPHPVWSTVLAVAAEAWGAYILLKG